MNYRLCGDGTMVVRDDGVYIPINDRNPDYQEYLRWTSAGNLPAPESTIPPTPDQYTAALQARMDDEARTRGYDDIRSGVSYLGSAIVQFANEATALNEWRDAVWLYGLTVLNSAQSGSSALPSLDDFVSAMPQMSWPKENASFTQEP
jgi:hypothetical protein